MEELIKIYQAEILMYKKAMVEFALKNTVAYNVAESKVTTYQRVVEDLTELMKESESNSSFVCTKSGGMESCTYKSKCFTSCVVLRDCVFAKKENK